MKTHRFLVVLFSSIFTLSLIWGTVSVNAASLTLDQSIHFVAADGSSVVIIPGKYQVEAAENWLRVIPGERRDALLLDAFSTTHNEAVEQPLVRLTPGQKDQYSLVLLLPNGTALEANGSISGVRSRAVSRAQVARAPKAPQRVAQSRQQPPQKAVLKNTTPSKRIPVQQNTGGGSPPPTGTLEQRIQLLEQQVHALMSVLQVTQGGATLQAYNLSLLSDKLTIQTQGPDGITIDSSADLKLSADLNLTAEGGLDVKLKSGINAKIEGGVDTTVESGSTLNLKGPIVYLGVGPGKKPLALVGSTVSGPGSAGQVVNGSTTVFSK